MKSYSVYIHTTPSKKRYVGITCKKPERRWQNGNGYKHQLAFYRAIIKYGWDNITHEIIADGLTEDKAKAMEIELISMYRTQNSHYGYNCTAGGDGSTGFYPSEETRAKMSAARVGKPLSDETKFKIGASQKGKYVSAETRAKIGAASKGRNRKHNLTAKARDKTPNVYKGCHLTEEHKAKISAALSGRHLSSETKTKLSIINMGRHPSEEARTKMSESHIGKRQSEETKAKRSSAMKGKRHTEEDKLKMSLIANRYKKTVYQYTLNGELIKIWDSLVSAMDKFKPGKMSSAIHNCVAGRAKKAYGYLWTYNPIKNEVMQVG
jgi:group I intron endonuclease